MVDTSLAVRSQRHWMKAMSEWDCNYHFKGLFVLLTSGLLKSDGVICSTRGF